MDLTCRKSWRILLNLHLDFDSHRNINSQGLPNNLLNDFLLEFYII